MLPRNFIMLTYHRESHRNPVPRESYSMGENDENFIQRSKRNTFGIFLPAAFHKTHFWKFLKWVFVGFPTEVSMIKFLDSKSYTPILDFSKCFPKQFHMSNWMFSNSIWNNQASSSLKLAFRSARYCIEAFIVPNKTFSFWLPTQTKI